MSMDFIKKKSVSDIVNKNYTDLQVQRSNEWIKGYQGDNILRDWLEFVPFDITPENRTVYNDTYEALSGLPREKFNAYRMQEIDAKLSEAYSPMDKLFVLQNVNSVENDDVANHYMPKLTQLQEYITTDFAHKSTISHSKALEESLVKLFSDPSKTLDALAPEYEHIKDISVLERMNKLGEAEIVNGRVSIKDDTGKYVVGQNLTVNDQGPDAAEQYAVQVNSFKPIQRAVKPHLDIARSITSEGKRQVDESLFANLDTLSIDDVAPVMANMLDYRDVETKGVVEKGLKKFKDSTNIQDKPRAMARIAGQLVSNIYKRGVL
tara:strand:+ start:8436 stop:9398 length:963 start_codon:yes stop_codon:yes gene_type:complete